MRTHDARLFVSNAAAIMLLLGSAAIAAAADITGVWANQPDACAKIYVKKQGKLQFTPSADMYGSGFIIEGSTIRGKTTTCHIRSIKEDGSTVKISAACANEIMVSETNFELRLEGKDRLVRYYPDVPEIAAPFVRCPKL